VPNKGKLSVVVKGAFSVATADIAIYLVVSAIIAFANVVL
jgi:hypothetical protein